MNQRMQSGKRGTSRREIVCLASDELAGAELDELRAQLPRLGIGVVVERRSRERRSGVERRCVAGRSPTGRERRRINNPGGRRLAERRAELVPVEWGELDRRALLASERLRAIEFVERLGLEEARRRSGS